MYVVTADQINSRNDRDRAGELLAALQNEYGHSFALPADQTAGDEIQIILTDAASTLGVILLIHRTGSWNTGLGLGQVRTPLAASTRQSAGEAFIAARDAVIRSKKADARFALDVPPHPNGMPDTSINADELEALITLTLAIRQRRTAEGWEVIDLLGAGLSQVEIAARLGISTGAVSQRLKTSLWRVEESARPALVRLMESLERATREMKD
ncbi:sigma factor-like helix-turn-helix DNA-binding protein [Leifsonia sp. A12D58]|uniref:sigma factor-like helix-turn-helix DNA-binding protein n=1 Tax=Leifsonia sp. A12D58 TaxID=3397674 RepID=UPI0039DFE3C0